MTVTSPVSALPPFPPVPPGARVTWTIDADGNFEITRPAEGTRKQPISCGVRDGALYVSEGGRRTRSWPIADIVALDGRDGVRVTYIAPDGWRADWIRMFEQGEHHLWLLDVLTQRVGLRGLPTCFAAPDLPVKSDEISYTFGPTSDPLRADQVPKRQSEVPPLRTQLPDGVVELEIPRRRLWRRAAVLDVLAFGGVAAVLIVFTHNLARILGYVLGAVVLLNMQSAWSRRYTRVTLRVRPGEAVLTRKTPYRATSVRLTEAETAGIWVRNGVLVSLGRDHHCTAILTGEAWEVLGEFATEISRALGLAPVAEPARIVEVEPAVGAVVEAPLAAPQRCSLRLHRVDPEGWRVEMPADRWLLLLPGIVMTVAIALIVWGFAAGVLKLAALGVLSIPCIGLMVLFHRSIVRGLFPTSLEVDPEKMVFHRPTLFGRQRLGCDRWAVSEVSVGRTMRRKLPTGSLSVRLRNRETIELFQDLPEEDVRWVALLLASSWNMTVAG